MHTQAHAGVFDQFYKKKEPAPINGESGSMSSLQQQRNLKPFPYDGKSCSIC